MKDKSLTLTIVIPVYNEQRYLKACLDSISKQTIKPNEVILVDNNSNDKTLHIARNYKYVQVLHEAKQGVFFAETKGFNAATSDIICRIDGDTILPGNWFSTVRDLFADQDVAAVTGPVNYYDMPFPKHNFWADHIMRKLTYVLAPRNPFLYGSNMAFRRSAWLTVKNEIRHEDNIHGDVEIAIHFFKHGQRILYTKKMLAKASGRRYNDSFGDFIRYIWMYQRVFKRHGLPTWVAYLGMFMWTLGYMLIHPWIRLWYSLLSDFGSNFPISSERRKNPMRS